jgi:cell division protein FtsZ
MKAITSPLLEDVSIDGALGVLMNITCGPDLAIDEVSEAASTIAEAAHENANIYFGTVFDENAGDEMRITVIATGINADRSLRNEPKGKVTQLGATRRSASGAQPKSQLAQARGAVSGGVLADDDLNIPAYLRHGRAGSQELSGGNGASRHAPGEDDFVFDEEEFEIPSFIRRQAD